MVRHNSGAHNARFHFVWRSLEGCARPTPLWDEGVVMEFVFKAIDLDIRYHTRQATLTAVRHVNFDVNAGQIVGLVGESGCGKSTIASAIMRLLPPNGEISGGKLLFKGDDLRTMSEDDMRRIRGRQ